MRLRFRIVDNTSGVGVLDKAAAILAALQDGPASLAELVARTGIARPTAHRLAAALEVHRLVSRDRTARFELGAWLGELAAAGGPDRLREAADGVLAGLRESTGESAQLYRREGHLRRCVASAEPVSGLRDTVPVGALLPMTAGSGAQVLLAWEPPEVAGPLLQTASFSARTLALVRRRGWAASAAEREAGVGSVSAPVRDSTGSVRAAISVSGPLDRLTRAPGHRHAGAVLAAAGSLQLALGWAAGDGGR